MAMKPVPTWVPFNWNAMLLSLIQTCHQLQQAKSVQANSTQTREVERQVSRHKRFRDYSVLCQAALHAELSPHFRKQRHNQTESLPRKVDLCIHNRSFVVPSNTGWPMYSSMVVVMTIIRSCCNEAIPNWTRCQPTNQPSTFKHWNKHNSTSDNRQATSAVYQECPRKLAQAILRSNQIDQWSWHVCLNAVRPNHHHLPDREQVQPRRYSTSQCLATESNVRPRLHSTSQCLSPESNVQPPLNREQCTTKTIQYLTMPLTREQCTTTSQQRAMYDQDYTAPHNASHQRAMYNHLSTESNVQPRLYSTSQCLSTESNVQPRLYSTTQCLSYLHFYLLRSVGQDTLVVQAAQYDRTLLAVAAHASNTNNPM